MFRTDAGQQDRHSMNARALRILPVAWRVLILSWEYPPVIEDGLARHVRKLSEALVSEVGAEVHVLTRAGASTEPREERHGVIVHRVATPPFPTDTNRFLDWVA